MSYHYAARTLIGYKLTNTKRFNLVQLPNCNDNPPADTKYCPVCGIRVGVREVRVPYNKWNQFEEAVLWNLPAGLAYEDNFELAEELWIGYGSPECPLNEAVAIAIRPYREIKAQVLALLEPYAAAGLFQMKDDDFAIWTLNIGR